MCEEPWVVNCAELDGHHIILSICRPESVAKGMIHLIEKGSSGSVWVAEGGEPVYEVRIPDRQTLKVE